MKSHDAYYLTSHHIGTYIFYLLLLFLTSCGGGSSSEDQLTENQVSGVKVAFPSMNHINGVVIEEHENPPPSPDGFVLDGKVYEVSVPDSAPFPAKVSIPASDELLADADNKQFVIGRYNGHSWDLMPAALIENSIVADVDHFSLIAIFQRLLKEPDEYTTDFFQTLTVSPPNFDWIMVKNDEIFAILDLGKSRVPYKNTGEIVPLSVTKWELSVLTPNVSIGRPNIRTGTFVPITFNGESFIHIPMPIQGPGSIPLTLDHFKIEINLTNLFDFSTIVNLLDRQSIPANYGSFVFRIRPIFNDENNTQGALSSLTYLPVGVADAQIRLKKGLADRLNADQKGDFIRRVSSTHYLLPYNKGWGEFYANPLTWGNAVYLTFFGVHQPLIGIELNTGWARVVSHEWGHYASHMLMGDEWTKNVTTGSHVGWKEANSRELAWAEDLATFFGQWGVNNRSNTLPEQSGAMEGDLTEYSTIKSENVTSGSVDDFWPNYLDMDAIKVESVAASILSRLSSKYSFADVMEIILSSHPINLTEFIDQWFEHYGMDSSESEFLQTICVDEGVTWVLNGHIEEEGSTNPLQGVSVYVNGVNSNLKLSPEGYSDVSGDFKINVPPGDVNIKLVNSGYGSIDDLTITANVDFETNVGFIDGEVKLYVSRAGVIDRDYESVGSAGAFRMQVREDAPIGGCPMIYDPNLDSDNHSGYLVININDKDNDGQYEDKFECSYWPSGQLMWDREVIDNKYNGYVIGYYETGETQKTTPYTNGKIEGIQTRYYLSGKIKETTPYTDNVENGTQNGFYESGNLEFLLPFTNGEFNGNYIYYYESSGTIQAMSYWINGVQNGAYNTFWENELPQYEGFYVDDKQHGEQKFYLETGILSSCEIWDNGVQVGSCMPE